MRRRDDQEKLTFGASRFTPSSALMLAIVAGETDVNYGDLDRRSSRLARVLLAHGGGGPAGDGWLRRRLERRRRDTRSGDGARGAAVGVTPHPWQ